MSTSSIEARHAYISLGANLEDAAGNIRRALAAVAALPYLEIGAVSPQYLSEPQNFKDQPFFVNRVAALICAPSATAPGLLEDLLRIEDGLGRERGGRRFGPRSIDLDLLLFGKEVMNDPRLILPHPRMIKRAFVLAPLARIAPGLALPCGGSVEDALNRLNFRIEAGVIYQQGE
ncbi:MAG: 2-amino-4-hydroxy-6-hydroxymethyldihydropteridine diphosphokinase [Desulfovibrio sp.]|jgi:2-amino-4-hydroxy-6-hydroxymethyldihydropteridine diphosphokinase|nr:2-amino-4-hydroxy-6-hydroxymethyldihydropteridine diphosphokinase [Desulfovibrio sp.]